MVSQTTPFVLSPWCDSHSIWSSTTQSFIHSFQKTVSTAEKVVKCDQCGNIFKFEDGLKIHVGKSHTKNPTTPDPLRQLSEPLCLPLLDTSREESSPTFSISETQINIFCNSCRSYMSPTHTCHECGKICNSRDDLGKHINTIHPTHVLQLLTVFQGQRVQSQALGGNTLDDDELETKWSQPRILKRSYLHK